MQYIYNIFILYNYNNVLMLLKSENKPLSFNKLLKNFRNSILNHNALLIL